MDVPFLVDYVQDNPSLMTTGKHKFPSRYCFRWSNSNQVHWAYLTNKILCDNDSRK